MRPVGHHGVNICNMKIPAEQKWDRRKVFKNNSQKITAKCDKIHESKTIQVY